MKKLISSGLIISLVGLIIALLFIFDSKLSSNKIEAQTRPTFSPLPTTTPCRPNLGNKVNPCEQKSSTKEQIEEQNSRAIEWEEKKKKILAADFPLKNETSIDADGDRKPDKILYQIIPWRDDFEGLLKITSAKNETLWEHKYYMGSRDLAKFLVEVLEYDSITSWVKNVFNKKVDYSFDVSKIKIKESEMDEAQIEYAAKLHKTTVQKLKSEISRQKINYVYLYRAEWREDLMQIVYVPSLNKFICYSRGY